MVLRCSGVCRATAVQLGNRFPTWSEELQLPIQLSQAWQHARLELWHALSVGAGEDGGAKRARLLASATIDVGQAQREGRVAPYWICLYGPTP